MSLTERQWLKSNSIAEMHPRCRRNRKRDLRKERLFACACCRRIWNLLTDPRSRAVVEAAEQYADGLIDKGALAAARVEAVRATRVAPRRSNDSPVAAAECLGNLEPYDVFFACTARVTMVVARCRIGTRKAEEALQAKFLRDIFGNPFRPVAFSPSWRTDTATALARTMYESREFSAMPILADALQDAGCDNDDILSHCRDGNQVHVRGCWVVDFVLGKE
jgi:hypothetical protein